MAIAEGTANLPTDDGGRRQWGQTDGTNLYFPRIDNTTARNTRVALYDSGGGMLLANAAALADGVANPTVGKLGVLPMAYNGATWDRLRTLAASGTGLGVLSVGTAYASLALFTALAITDTADHATAVLDVSLFGQKWIDLYSTLNQPITEITIWIDNQATQTGYVYRGTGLAVYMAHFYPTGTAAPSSQQELAVSLPVLGVPAEVLYVKITCGVAPASGSVTMELRGVL